MRRWTSRIILLIALCSLGCERRSATEENVQEQVVNRAYLWEDGDGYFLNGTGVTSALIIEEFVVLPPSPQGSHCSGFTLAVCLSVAEELGMTHGWSGEQLRTFQKQWFGVEPASRQRQMAYALEKAGIGREVPLGSVRPGDFIQFNVGRSGHIAVVTNLIQIEDRLVGLNYRSSQPSTDGIGDRYFYFNDTIFNGPVKRELCTVARLGEGS